MRFAGLRVFPATLTEASACANEKARESGWIGAEITLRNAMPIIAVLCATLMLAACASGDDVPYTSQGHGPQTFPTDYKSDLLGLLRTYLTNPANLRDAMVSEPTPRDVRGQSQSLYVACLRYNAKNAAGSYQGVTQHLAIYVDGRLDSISDRVGDTCATANYQPFPEAEHLTR
jgi:hypothetical protein